MGTYVILKWFMGMSSAFGDLLFIISMRDWVGNLIAGLLQ